MRLTVEQVLAGIAPNEFYGNPTPFERAVIERMPQYDACPCELEELAAHRLGHSARCRLEDMTRKSAWIQALEAQLEDERLGRVRREERGLSLTDHRSGQGSIFDRIGGTT